MTGCGERGDDFIFFFFVDQHHFRLHLITFADRLIKVWGPLIYSLLKSVFLKLFSISAPPEQPTDFRMPPSTKSKNTFI